VDRLLTRLKYCQPEHVSALFEVLNFHSLRTSTIVGDEDDFFSRALKSSWMTEKQVQFLRGLQEEASAAGHPCAPVGWTAIQKGILTEPRVIALYMRQEESRRGLLFEVHRALELLGAPLPDRIPHSVLDRRWLGATAATVLLALLIINLLAAFGQAGTWADKVSVVTPGVLKDKAPRIHCESCGRTFAETLHDPELRCPACGQKAPSARLTCLDCGARQEVKPHVSPVGPGQPIRMPACPKCGSHHVELRLHAPSHKNL
jgi:Zn finger protein HypA/HybF involved in hydrogenase expression